MSYQLIRSYTYPEGQTYQGKAVKGAFIFKTPAGVWGDSIANDMIGEFQDKMEDEGYRMLSYKLLGDFSGIITSTFYCEIAGYDPSVISGRIAANPVALIAALRWIIPLVVQVVIAVLIYLSIKTIAEINWPDLAPVIKWAAIGIIAVAAAVAAVAYSPRKKVA